MSKIVFSHANGYHPNIYKVIFDNLQNVDVHSILFGPYRSDVSIDSFYSWHQLKDELIDYIESNDLKASVGVGHSMGGIATLLAAAENPNLFKRIILFDPVILPRYVYWLLGIPCIPLKLKLAPPSRIALHRKDTFSSHDEVYQYYRPKSVFKNLTDEILWSYVVNSFEPYSDGVKLKYTKEWEARVYATGTKPWSAIRNISVPVTIVRGVSSDVINDCTWERLKRIRPDFELITLENAGHLVPLEQVSKSIEIIQSRLN